MKVLLSIFTDLILLTGAGSVFYGTYLIYKPASYIIIGIMLIILGYPKRGINDNW